MPLESAPWLEKVVTRTTDGEIIDTSPQPNPDCYDRDVNRLARATVDAINRNRFNNSPYRLISHEVRGNVLFITVGETSPEPMTDGHSPLVKTQVG